MDDNRFNGKSLDVIEKEADELSLQNQKEYVTCLRLLAIIGTAMVGSLLLYNNFGMSRLIFVYAALLISGGFVLVRARKNKYHENYIKYRLLSEVLRVQNVLDSAGIKKNAVDYFSFTMQSETKWIREIVESAVHEYGTGPTEELKKLWLQDQYDYHVAAEKKIRNKAKYNKKISDFVKMVVVATVVLMCILECVSSAGVAEGAIRGIKNELAIITGIVSALSVFLSSYYGKQKFQRKINDHTEMSKLYKTALNKTENSPLTTEIVVDIAREEILENGNWYSYMKENKPSLKI